MKARICECKHDDRNENFQIAPIFSVMISRAAAATTSARIPTSIRAAASRSIFPEKTTARRPAANATTRTSNGLPWSGSRRVQLGMAVSRNPVTMTAHSQTTSHEHVMHRRKHDLAFEKRKSQRDGQRGVAGPEKERPESIGQDLGGTSGAGWGPWGGLAANSLAV